MTRREQIARIIDNEAFRPGLPDVARPGTVGSIRAEIERRDRALAKADQIMGLEEAALSASQAEVERLTRDVDQFVTCMCGQSMSADHYALGHAPVSVAEHYYNEQYARAQAAEARATRAEGLLAEAGEVLGPFADVAQLLIAEPGVSLSISKGDGTVLVEDSDYHTARAFLDKLKEQGQ